MNNIKIAFIDLDGTLTNSMQQISENNLKALKILKSNNIKIVLTTGRWDSYIYSLIDINLIDYIITNNGACIINTKNNEVIYEETFSNNDIENIYNYCNQNNLDLIFNGLFKRYKSIEEIDSSIYQGVIICKSKKDMDNLIKFTTDSNNLKLAYISYAYYKNIDKDRYTANINLSKTNKGNTVNYLLNKLNIDKKDSMCFGDNDNDLDMFDICGVKIAMENSLDKLKNKADYITLTNNNDGVYDFIKKHFKED